MSVDRSIAPQVREFGRLDIEPLQKLKTASGTDVYVLDKGDEPVCMLAVLFPCGDMMASSNELMKVLTSTWREGSQAYTADEIADTLDFYGAWMTINSTLRHTQFSLYCLTSRLNKILPMLTDMILRPLFSAEPVSRIRNKLISTNRINRDKAKTAAREMIKCQLLGSGHPYARKETEQGFEEVTADGLKLMHSKIISTRPVIFLSGKLTGEAIDATLRFAGEITPAEPSEIKLSLNEITPDHANRILSKLMPEKSQSAIIMGIPAVNRSHPDYNQLRITVLLLGGYFGSRLMSNIREEKGYTYGINASLVGYNELGYIQIECECDNSYVDAVIEETKKELTRLATEPVTDEELSTVKRIIKSSLASILNDPFETAGFYVGQMTIGYPADYFYAQQKALDAITPEKVMEMAKKYLRPDNIFVAIAGGKADN